MTRHLVVLEHGHSATSVGAEHGGLCEYDLVGWALLGMEEALRERGIDVQRVPGVGSLLDRQALGIGLIRDHHRRYPGARGVYVSGHLNAAGMRRVVFHDQASAMGQAVATHIASRTVLVADAAPGEHFARVAHCIGRIFGSTPAGYCGILVEFEEMSFRLLSGATDRAVIEEHLRALGEEVGIALAKYLKESA